MGILLQMHALQVKVLPNTSRIPHPSIRRLWLWESTLISRCCWQTILYTRKHHFAPLKGGLILAQARLCLLCQMLMQMPEHHNLPSLCLSLPKISCVLEEGSLENFQRQESCAKVELCAVTSTQAISWYGGEMVVAWIQTYLRKKWGGSCNWYFWILDLQRSWLPLFVITLSPFCMQLQQVMQFPSLQGWLFLPVL